MRLPIICLQRNVWVVVTYHAHGYSKWRCRCFHFKSFFLKHEGQIFENCWHIQYLQNNVDSLDDFGEVDDELQTKQVFLEDNELVEEEIVEEEIVPQTSDNTTKKRSSSAQLRQMIEDIQSDMNQNTTTRSATNFKLGEVTMELSENENERWVHKINNRLLWLVPYGRGNCNEYCWVFYSARSGHLKCKCSSPNTPSMYFCFCYCLPCCSSQRPCSLSYQIIDHFPAYCSTRQRNSDQYEFS